MKTGIKTSDEIWSLLTARGHFSRTLSWFGRCPGIDKHFTRIRLQKAAANTKRKYTCVPGSAQQLQRQHLTCCLAASGPCLGLLSASNLDLHYTWVIFRTIKLIAGTDNPF